MLRYIAQPSFHHFSLSAALPGATGYAANATTINNRTISVFSSENFLFHDGPNKEAHKSCTSDCDDNRHPSNILPGAVPNHTIHIGLIGIPPKKKERYALIILLYQNLLILSTGLLMK